MRRKSLSWPIITMMLLLTALIVFWSGFLQFSSVGTSFLARSKYFDFPMTPNTGTPEAFTDLLDAFRKWDNKIGCRRFAEQQKVDKLPSGNGFNASLQIDGSCDSSCDGLNQMYVKVLVSGWTWIPDNLDNLYSCPCGLTCLWTKSRTLADHPDALLYESVTPPVQRRSGNPLRVYMDLEAERKRSGYEDLFISYHSKDDVQATYAGSTFHTGRNYHVSSNKNNETLVYWSSSRCLDNRNQLARSILGLLPHHSFGKCLNNVGGADKALLFYPECRHDSNVKPKWSDHLHCAMSHYKFVLAIENTMTESYVTEKLFYALDSGAIPIYFGAPNVMDFVPPNSIIDATKFSSMAELASYVKALANDPVAYSNYHAWRRCGLMGNYRKVRSLSLDTLPCRLCAAVSRNGGRNAGA